MKKQSLLVTLQHQYPQHSKEQLYSKILCGEVVLGSEASQGRETLRDPGQPVPPNALLLLRQPQRYVSRGGDKLACALVEFRPQFERNGFRIAGSIALDAGASSGGFSDCLLQHGCRMVYAVDSGRNQLDFKLRRNPRVQSFESCKIQDFLRDLPDSGLAAPDFVVMDISFRSILPLVPLALRHCGSGIFLCKPQFEWQSYSRTLPPQRRIDFDGVVEDALAEQIFEWFCQQLRLIGPVRIEILATCPSPLQGGRGAKGNREFLLYLRQGESLAAPHR